jgi:hypothetical protein
MKKITDSISPNQCITGMPAMSEEISYLRLNGRVRQHEKT